MKITNTNVMNLEGAFRGLRNPLQSWDKSDSKSKFGGFIVGPNDMNLAKRLIKADESGDGQPNSKFLRQIIVSVDIEAPLYLWKEIDTYKIGTVANSTSTMHKLATTPITLDCFETGDYDGDLPILLYREIYGGQGGCTISNHLVSPTLQILELLRKKYLETNDKRYWKELIRWLPESWLQTRTMTLNYSTLRNIYHWRKNHKLTEWHTICDWIKTLPYAKQLICDEGE